MSEHNGRASSVLSAANKQLFIDGEFVGAEGGATFEVLNPATEEVLCTVSDASPADGMRALEAAAAAQADFAATPALKRHDMLLRAYELMMERQDDLALLMTLEMGKAIAESAGEIAYAAEFFRHFAAQALSSTGGGYQTSPQGGARFIVSKQPVGPCLLITPWNFPTAMGTRKIGPALAAGCTCVLKPAQQTPLSMLALVDILREAGVPQGVVNIITTTSSGEVMEPLITSGIARKLSFTGSTGVGKTLLKQAANKVLRTSMELGGNAPFVVFDDADVDEAVAGCMQAKMRNMGEACTAANRIYVQSGVYQAFAGKLTTAMSQLTVGDGTQEGTKVGPLIDRKAQASVDALVHDAVDVGAQVLTGGQQPAGEGYFYPPTVLTGVPAFARLASEEIFGPVAALMSFDTEDEAVASANDTEFGLVAYVFTNDLRRALRVAERIEAGMVGLNQGVVSNPYAPFGGVKESGVGREGGSVGIEEYQETKYIGITM
ncbi:MAG: NAD-dependent succinate-semialdehyde dehydrogenase [Ornithinimicrobium sp.]